MKARVKVKVKAKEQPSGQDRIWCDGCRIRIAPVEDRITEGDKVYHARCHSRLSVPPTAPPEH